MLKTTAGAPVRHDVVTPRLLTIPAAAQYLSCTVWFVRTLVWGKKLRSITLGNRIVFDRADLDDYIEQLKQVA